MASANILGRNSPNDLPGLSLGLTEVPRILARAVGMNFPSAGARQARYTRGPGADEPVGVVRGGAYYSYQRDALRSVTRLTDSAQASAKSYRYDAWGRTTTETGTLTNRFQFTGRERNAGGPLYYVRARTYDPEVGGFTSKDPAGMVDGTNLYGYAGGNPVARTDPSGRWFEGCYGWECQYGSDSPPLSTLENQGAKHAGGGGVRTGQCTVSLIMFAIGIGFAGFLGIFLPTWQLESFEARASLWLTGGAGFAFTGGLGGLATTAFSIFWFVLWNVWLPSLGWWSAALNAVTLAGRLNIVGLGLLTAYILAMSVIFMIGLRTANCISP